MLIEYDGDGKEIVKEGAFCELPDEITGLEDNTEDNTVADKLSEMQSRIRDGYANHTAAGLRGVVGTMVGLCLLGKVSIDEEQAFLVAVKALLAHTPSPKKVKAYGLEVEVEVCPVCNAEMELHCMQGECFFVCPEQSCESERHPMRVGLAKTEYQIACAETREMLTEAGCIF